MKKTKFRTDKRKVFVAMSQQDGCIVLVSGTGDDTQIVGSLDRENTIKFCDAVLAWMPTDLNKPDQPAEDAVLQ